MGNYGMDLTEYQEHYESQIREAVLQSEEYNQLYEKISQEMFEEHKRELTDYYYDEAKDSEKVIDDYLHEAYDRQLDDIATDSSQI
jgi:hypothetical protein